MTTFKPLAIALAFTSLFWLGSVAKSAEPNTTTTQVLHRTVKIDGLDIFYREAGPKDAPTVLLLHGFPTSSHMFRNLIPALADKYHVIAPTIRALAIARPRPSKSLITRSTIWQT